MCDRWQPGVRLLPATDDRLETHVVVESDSGGEEAIHFQEWWIRHRAARSARRFVFLGAESARPAPGVLEAIETADAILFAPSNPVVSIAPILAVPGVRDAIRSATAPVIGVSPIIGGAPVRGMADTCLAVIGVECSASGVGRMYGARSADGLLDRWLVDAEADADTEVPGVTVRAVPLWMTDDQATAAMVAAGLEST